ncbi:MAG: hypothetical protein A3B24_00590 [Candidatus Wildermuthbacteria bacterium RIFCSPLOWO2_01_FULL_48_16]|uniref:Transcobalamin-like C-terminal domain-containing protein n=1 Tax=Candidatus Wildermuthbacteria bacterium RIFCSPLOWO2_01_FULL_48_16 TaxID=1802461 RepID=A0A1G2RL10_9BACT|nr:MAG: hypothetical protein A3J57_01185 [Candidatus Wildermuthbacteria bacterium RIFCSPHIGHO2_02_FULL_49_12b]OHA72721.1 MAG: hypothetical protein A3B24_00590 [Candidatus Wildermuthbacteria bacterium RIFCSPLOWO2_01_FULL_48_16]
MKKAVQFLLLFGSAALVLGLAEAWVGQTEDRTSELVLVTETELVTVSLVVEEERHEVEVRAGSSVYDVLEAAKEQGLSFKGREFSGMGFFVEEINGKAESNRQRMYWIYSVNNKKAEVGVSSYIIQPNDVITWTYEKSY